MIQENHKGFIEELRELDEPTKKKILIGTVVVIMILVVYLWLIYFNSIVSSAAAPIAQPAGTITASTASSVGILGLFATTMASFWQTVRDGAGNVLGSMENVKQYHISPK